MKATFNFEIDTISKYRTELMGISILGIMLAHIWGWTEIQNDIIQKMIDLFSRLSHTNGFLLLSGFGLFYSMSKYITPPACRNLTVSRPIIYSFWRRRVMRLVIPFLVISCPFYVYSDLYINHDILEYILDQSSLYFWFYGNNGMWYISISILLYFCFPLFYSLINNKFSNCLLLCFFVYAIVFGISKMFPEYYQMTVLGLPKISIFIFGCYVGYLAYSHRTINMLLLALLVLPVIYLMGKLKQTDAFFSNPYEDCVRLITIPLCCLALNVITRIKFLKVIMVILRFLGKYSLELFVLHMLMKGSIFNSELGLCYPLCGALLFFLSVVLCYPVHLVIDSITRQIK